MRHELHSCRNVTCYMKGSAWRARVPEDTPCLACGQPLTKVDFSGIPLGSIFDMANGFR